GVAKPPGPAIDGRSLWPLLQGEDVEWEERLIFTDRIRNAELSNPRGSVRSQRWRAVRENNQWSLFDMEADPGQEAEVGGQHPEVLEKLSGSFDNWLDDVTSDGLDYIPIPIGHPKRAMAELPANEAFLKPAAGEGIDYISRPGNANAWIVNWTDARAYPQWEVEVLRSAEYEITLMYNCRERDVGAKVRVEIGGQGLDGQIQEAFYPEYDPSPDRLPKEDDHYEEKDWAPLSLGTVQLEQGRTTLTVKALSKPGEQVMEL
ncbi:MAG: hypothetical protein GY953_43810, partial [bacterium]|nr:hypothetical protein [bacterium]